jgi:hypothetical protein
MEHSEKSHKSPQPLGILTKDKKGTGCTIKEQIVDELSVVKVQKVELIIGQGEYHMEVVYGQKILEAIGDPYTFGNSITLGTMTVVTRAVGLLSMPTHIANIPVCSHLTSAAPLNISHHLRLFGTQTMIGPVLLTIEPEYIGYLILGPIAPCLGQLELILGFPAQMSQGKSLHLRKIQSIIPGAIRWNILNCKGRWAHPFSP